MPNDGTMLRPSNEGGVEEKKEDTEQLSPKTLKRRSSSQESGEKEEEEETGFRALLESFAQSIFGSCGSAIEAASFFVQGQGCRWPVGRENPTRERPTRPPLSIAEELKRLAMQEGEAVQRGYRAADIPKFLGEDAVYSFEDDNISAISQNTLEEMSRNGIVHPMCRRHSQHSVGRPPSPTRTTSSSTNSSKERRKRDSDHFEA